MKKTGIFYGSTTGTTESVAGMIAGKLGVSSADVHDVSKMTADMVNSYDVLFGCGDSESYADTFCDGMGIIYEDLKGTGCEFINGVSDADYTYSSSVAVVDGMFVGLAIDEMNESGKTDERVTAWTEHIKTLL